MLEKADLFSQLNSATCFSLKSCRYTALKKVKLCYVYCSTHSVSDPDKVGSAQVSGLGSAPDLHFQNLSNPDPESMSKIGKKVS